MLEGALQSENPPTKVFDRTSNLQGTQIISYRVSEDQKWSTLVGIAPGSTEKCAFLACTSSNCTDSPASHYCNMKQRFAYITLPINTASYLLLLHRDARRVRCCALLGGPARCILNSMLRAVLDAL